MASGVSYRFTTTGWTSKPVEEAAMTAFSWALASAVIDTRTNFDQRLPKTARQQTGNLRSSVRALREGKLLGRLQVRTKYAASQELGSQPHEIKARRKPNLVFPWDGRVSYGGPETSATWTSTALFIGPRVFHPGTKGTHSTLDAAVDAIDNFRRFIARIL